MENILTCYETFRLTFTQHLMVHYTPSDNSGYDRAIMEQDGRISPTMSGDRSEYEYEDFEDINVPRINSQVFLVIDIIGYVNWPLTKNKLCFICWHDDL